MPGGDENIKENIRDRLKKLAGKALDVVMSTPLAVPILPVAGIVIAGVEAQKQVKNANDVKQSKQKLSKLINAEPKEQQTAIPPVIISFESTSSVGSQTKPQHVGAAFSEVKKNTVPL